MKQEGWLSILELLVCLCLGTLGPAQGGKVLVMPVDGSHWLSMELLVKELSLRGHDVVVLVPETSLLIKGSDYYRVQAFHVPYSQAELAGSLNSLKNSVFLEPGTVSDTRVNMKRLINFTSIQLKGCEGLLYDEPLVQQLQDEAFELMLTDPFLPCGSIIAHALSLPAVYFLRGIPCGLDLKASQCPSPPSFVPRFYTGNTDRMDFFQRVINVLMSVLEDFLCLKMFAGFDELTSRFLGQDITYKELISHGAIWLLRYDFIFEYPRPIMPNMIHIGGINCAKRKPLPSVSVLRRMAQIILMPSLCPAAMV